MIGDLKSTLSALKSGLDAVEARSAFYAPLNIIPRLETGKWKLEDLADATAFCVPITLGLGRCANFLNGELWGRPTDAWWGVIFPDAPRVPIPDVPGLWMNVPRYPSQLVEALLEGLLLQLILIAVRFSMATSTSRPVGVMRIICFSSIRSCTAAPGSHSGGRRSSLWRGV